MKIIFLRDDLFTEYDLTVIGEWQAGFTLPDADDQTIVDDVVRYHGTEGAPLTCWSGSGGARPTAGGGSVRWSSSAAAGAGRDTSAPSPGCT